MSWDPQGYVDGMNLYEYLKSNPVNGLDPTGRVDAPDRDGCMPPEMMAQYAAHVEKLWEQYEKEMAAYPPQYQCYRPSFDRWCEFQGDPARDAMFFLKGFEDRLNETWTGINAAIFHPKESIVCATYALAHSKDPGTALVDVYLECKDNPEAQGRLYADIVVSCIATACLEGAGEGIASRNMASAEARVGVSSAFDEAQVLSRGARPRASYGTTFPEYLRFRGQGFTPAQAKYLTQPYDGMGHHFFARRWGLPDFITESPLSVMKPQGISIGRFYERHFLGDLSWNGTRFPTELGGVWTGNLVGLERPSLGMRLWYATPRSLKITAGGAAAGGAGGLTWWLLENDDQ